MMKRRLPIRCAILTGAILIAAAPCLAAWTVDTPGANSFYTKTATITGLGFASGTSKPVTFVFAYNDGSNTIQEGSKLVDFIYGGSMWTTSLSPNGSATWHVSPGNPQTADHFVWIEFSAAASDYIESGGPITVTN